MCPESPGAEATFFSLCFVSSMCPQQLVTSLTPRGCLITAHPCLSDNPATLSPPGRRPQPPRKTSSQNTSQGSIFICKLTHSLSPSLSFSLLHTHTHTPALGSPSPPLYCSEQARPEFRVLGVWSLREWRREKALVVKGSQYPQEPPGGWCKGIRPFWAAGASSAFLDGGQPGGGGRSGRHLTLAGGVGAVRPGRQRGQPRTTQ